MSKQSPSDMSLAKHQSFVIETVSRREIKAAPYNPRKISPQARKRLAKKIKEVGLVEPLVWNRRTGHLVSGHQRLSILDELEKSNDYKLTVAVVDLPEDEEKRLNVFLNNTDSMGEFDFDKLSELIQELGNTTLPESLGFDKVTVDLLVGENPLFSEEADEAGKEIKDIMHEIKSFKSNARQTLKNQDDAEFYLVLVFADRAGADNFLEYFNLDPNNRYVDGDMILDIIKRGGTPP